MSEGYKENYKSDDMDLFSDRSAAGRSEVLDFIPKAKVAYFADVNNDGAKEIVVQEANGDYSVFVGSAEGAFVFDKRVKAGELEGKLQSHN